MEWDDRVILTGGEGEVNEENRRVTEYAAAV